MTGEGTGGQAAAPHTKFACIVCLKSYFGTVTLARDSVCLMCRAELANVGTYQVEHKSFYLDQEAVGANSVVRGETFVKDDSGKPPLDMLALLDDGFAVEIAKAIEWGGRHYGFDNWKKAGMTWRRYLGAPIRHIFKFIRGESIDPVTGIHHLAHAVVSLMFVFVAERDSLGVDDRIKTEIGR